MTDKEKIQKLMEMLARLGNEAEYVVFHKGRNTDYLDTNIQQSRVLLKEVDPSFDFNKL
jgi:hypothetical protein